MTRSRAALYYLGVLGMPGMTAYFGLLDIGQPKAWRDGGRLGRLRRGRQRGRPDREDQGLPRRRHRRRQAEMRLRHKELGFDACVDYKAGKLDERPEGRLPERHRRATSRTSAARSSTRCCERMNLSPHRGLRPDSQYNADRALRREEHARHPDQPHQDAGLHRLRPEGSLWRRRSRRSPVRWPQGKIKYRETVVEGLENAPKA